MVRRDILHRLKTAAREFPVVTIAGPRQSEKTTLFRMAFPKRPYVGLDSRDWS
jgi:predicted AAA+ superfamily ATPase